MKLKLQAFLSFFRIVNLPTVPGDVLVGAVSAIALSQINADISYIKLIGASISSCFIYLFGLADNDIIGAKSDVNRPIPNGEISLKEAKLSRACVCAIALLCGFLFKLPLYWFITNLVLILLCCIYNRTKNSFLMGLCRALNVCSGITLIETFDFHFSIIIAPFIWVSYITILTMLAKSEDTCPTRKTLICKLIAALVYLQLLSLIIFYLLSPTFTTRICLITGAILLFVLRLFKRVFPKVSAS